jgi:LysR family hydrogen peroxide-inducible transcriptional activator
MNLQQVRYFVALCETRNFALAARRCGVAQPSLTHSIRVLEAELGGRLFNRRPTRPTELGEALRSHFESIVSALDETSRIAAAFREDPRPMPKGPRELHRLARAGRRKAT